MELGIEVPRHREHAGRGGEVDDLGVLADVDAEPEAGLFRVAAVDVAMWPIPQAALGARTLAPR